MERQMEMSVDDGEMRLAQGTVGNEISESGSAQMRMRGRRGGELETRKEVGERRMHERMGEMTIKD